MDQICKCEVCGKIVRVVHTGAGTLVCCEQEMSKLVEQTADYKVEKHVPVIEKMADGFLVKVGNVPHPMTNEHYIEWIELIADGVSYVKYLKPGDEPKAEFCLSASDVKARDYCNVHKLWKN